MSLRTKIYQIKKFVSPGEVEGDSAASVQVVLGDLLNVGHQVENGVEVGKVFAIGETKHACRISRWTTIEE